LELQCVQPQLAPYGPGYDGVAQACAITGAEPGSLQLSGRVYLAEALHFYQSHVWRNFGIVVAIWFFFLFLCCVTIERLPAAGSNKAILLYKRGGGGKFIRASAQNGNEPKDEEEGAGETQVTEKPSNKNGKSKKDGKKDESEKPPKEVHSAGT
jgi:ATP-binding cassette subfamily G (WHITE) protein 2 (SNQ2)